MLHIGAALIWIPAVVAVVIVVRGWISSKACLGDKLGPLNWSFSDSWASNLTVLAVLFDTLFATELLPATGLYVTAETYKALGVLFASLVVLGPLIYVALAGQHTKDKEYQLQGYVRGFLPAAAIILWAVGGQLATTLVLTIDLLGSTLQRGVAYTLVALSVIAPVAALWHGGRSVRFILHNLRPSQALLGEARAPRWTMP